MRTDGQTDRQTDRQDEANSLFPHAKAPKMHPSDPPMNSSIKIFRQLEMVFEPYRMLLKHLKGWGGREEKQVPNTMFLQRKKHIKNKKIFWLGEGEFWLLTGRGGVVEHKHHKKRGMTL